MYNENLSDANRMTKMIYGYKLRSSYSQSIVPEISSDLINLGLRLMTQLKPSAPLIRGRGPVNIPVVHACIHAVSNLLLSLMYTALLWSG